MIIKEATLTYKTIGTIEGDNLQNPQDVYKAALTYLEKLDSEKEHFVVIAVNQKNKPKAFNLVSTGSVSATIVHCREVFKTLILQGTSSFFCFHNHPSGDPVPSKADIAITKTLKEAGQLLSIPLLDHVIIGDKDEDPNLKGFYSFSDAGLI